MVETINILNVMISNVNYNDALEEAIKWLKKNDKNHYIVTPNPEIIVAAQKNIELRNILNRADLSLPDGIGLLWACNILGKPLKGRVTGVDFMMKLCESAAKNGFTIGLIGGRNGIAIKAADCLKKKCPQLQVVFAQEEWEKGSKSMIHKFPIDILFVAYGAPKQEIWISTYLKDMPVKVAIGVGGAFDYFAGVLPRAPEWIQSLGLEWLFRLIRQPWRFKRQLALGKFVLLVLNEKLFSKVDQRQNML